MDKNTNNCTIGFNTTIKLTPMVQFDNELFLTNEKGCDFIESCL